MQFEYAENVKGRLISKIFHHRRSGGEISPIDKELACNIGAYHNHLFFYKTLVIFKWCLEWCNSNAFILQLSQVWIFLQGYHRMIRFKYLLGGVALVYNKRNEMWHVSFVFRLQAYLLKLLVEHWLIFTFFSDRFGPAFRRALSLNSAQVIRKLGWVTAHNSKNLYVDQLIHRSSIVLYKNQLKCRK